jgi:hypothetical protein
MFDVVCFVTYGRTAAPHAPCGAPRARGAHAPRPRGASRATSCRSPRQRGGRPAPQAAGRPATGCRSPRHRLQVSPASGGGRPRGARAFGGSRGPNCKPLGRPLARTANGVSSRRPLAAAARSVNPSLPPGGRRAGVRSPHDHFQSSSLNEIIVACPRQWPEQTDFALQAQCTAGLPAPRCIESWRANGHVAALHTQIGAIRVRAIEARRGSWPATRMAAPKRDAIGARRHQPRHLAVVWPLLEKGTGCRLAPRIKTARTISHAIRTARATSGTGCKSPPDRASHAQAPPKPPTTQTRVSDGGATAPATLAARATRAAAGRAAPLREGRRFGAHRRDEPR